MDCRQLEERLEALLDGELSELERRRCRRHLAQCPSCRELAEPFAASVAATPPGDLVRAVLDRTSGPACGRAESRLGAWLEGELAATDRQLVAAHLEACPDCRALAAAIRRLAEELPRLAELRPDPGFVAAVMAATLPPRVRLRRWWAAVWPRWVRRPRFASEAAFVATIALVLVFATPGSPLEAVPARTVRALAQAEPAERLEAPLGALERRLAAQSAGWARGAAEARAWARAAEAGSRTLAAAAGRRLGTPGELLASLMGMADKEASESPDPPSPTEETP